MAIFYDLSGRSIEDTDEFLKYYNKFYYTDYPGKIKGVHQNSRFIEEKIEDIFKNGIKENIDVIHILAWKMGKISHSKSEEERRFVYHSDWRDVYNLDYDHKYDINDLDLKIYNYKKKKQEKLNISVLVEYVVKTSNYYSDWGNDIAMTVLNKMMYKSPNGIGTVYMITLLYFMTKGEFPIYDQYADRALRAISGGEEAWVDLKAHDLPVKQDKLGEKVIAEDSYYIKQYKANIDNIFNYDNYIQNRDIDRALWVYGHLFDKSTNKMANYCSQELINLNNDG